MICLRRFVVSRGGAVVWPEVEAFLSFSSWTIDNVEAAAQLGARRIDPHHLTDARRALQITGELEEQRVVLQGRPVSAWIHVPTRDQLQATAIDRRAAARRRRYRTFLGWTRNETCGDIAERVTHATLQALAGRHVWVEHVPRAALQPLMGAWCQAARSIMPATGP